MDGIKHVADYGKGFVTYYLYPATTGQLVFIVVYTIFSMYFYNYLFRYPLFKWMYLGSIVILIGSIYGETNGTHISPDFKLGQ